MAQNAVLEIRGPVPLADPCPLASDGNGSDEDQIDGAHFVRRYGAAEIGRLRVVRTLRRAGYSTMAILRMLLRFDQGQTGALRQILDTPRPDEDAIYAADRWLSTLATHEERARDVITQLEAMTRKRQK